jgi:nitrogen fixation/metabolism regulation signal transduction histidine kinase
VTYILRASGPIKANMKSFSVKIIIRIALLLLTMSGLAFIFGRVELFFNHIILGILLVLQVYELLRYVQRTNRELAKLLLSIKNNDFTTSFNSMKQDRQFRELHDAFREIIEAYKDVKIEKEAQYEYLRLIVRHIKVGIISIKGEDEIALINQPALDILQTATYHYWHNLKNSHPRFVEQIAQMRENESRLLDIPVKGEVKRLSVHVSSAVLLRQPYRIITFQDIAQELNQSEIEAWHKLIRILTHEIMNSVTPISSLSETMLLMLQSAEARLKKPEEVDGELLEDLAYSLRTIQKRSDGLLGFVEDYRKLTKIPQPQPERVSVRELFDDIRRLMRAELKKQGIQLQQEVEPAELQVWADRRLLEQILINLLTNSQQALQRVELPQIRLSGKEAGGNILLEVADNGPGIPEDKLDKIFVPFFSTKEKGSGIGLSLSRNIMNLHGGSIKVSAPAGGPTVFSLYFPKSAVTVNEAAQTT